LAIPIDLRRPLLLTLVVTLALAGCIRLPTLRFNSPFGETNWVALTQSQVLEKPSPAFVVTVTNQKNQPLWVRFLIDEIDGANDCADVFQLDPESSYTYRCPQATLKEGAGYRAELTVFKDFGNTEVAERLNRIVLLRMDEEGGYTLIGQDPN
jgi:hypothetical protein